MESGWWLLCKLMVSVEWLLMGDWLLVIASWRVKDGWYLRAVSEFQSAVGICLLVVGGWCLMTSD